MSVALEAARARRPRSPRLAGLPARAGRLAWFAGALLATAVALVSYRYVVGIGPTPASIAANRFVRPWIVVHAGGAATALLLGPWQFLPGLRRRRPRLHRLFGRAYVAGCCAGGVSAAVLAAGTIAGPVAAIGFVALDLLWLATTALGTIAAIDRREAAHRRWMIRSVALTAGAVTLRLYIPVAVWLEIPFPVAYRAIVWLAWVPNAIAAELYLRRATSAPP